MLRSALGADHRTMTTSSHLLSARRHDRAPMPVDAPPVGRARARRLRLVQLRESALRTDAAVDVDAVADAIARRATFTRDLAARLAEELRDERVLDRRAAV